jgi:YidC/Oxa1 family membrane protein insertase
MNKFNKILINVIVFFGIFLVLNTILKSCQNEQPQIIDDKNPIVISSGKNEYSRLEKIKIEIKNNSSSLITIQNDCPGEPLNVYRYENSEFVQKKITPAIDCKNAKPIEIAQNEKKIITYDNWNFELFKEMGRYKVDTSLTIDGETKIFSSNEFVVVKEGVIKQLLYAIFYKPIYNLLVLLLTYFPGHDLGLAIIILTLIIRTILLIPNNKAMLSQRKLAELQPRIEKIKEKYKGDQQKISLETMALWKESKVNPFGSCLPLLMQFPILIALFYVIQGGLNPDNLHLLYSNYNGFDPNNIGTIFLGILDLTKPNIYILPLIVGGLQFLQLKLAQIKKPIKKETKPSELEAANNMMQYIMPVMIAVFTASLPAGVGLYWGVSTTYGIIQQIFINKSKSTASSMEPEVRVIEKK